MGARRRRRRHHRHLATSRRTSSARSSTSTCPARATRSTAGDTFGEIESVKSVSELFAPVSGEIVEVNDALGDSPETVNSDPHGEGWMIKVKLERRRASSTRSCPPRTTTPSSPRASLHALHTCHLRTARSDASRCRRFHSRRALRRHPRGRALRRRRSTLPDGLSEIELDSLTALARGRERGARASS